MGDHGGAASPVTNGEKEKNVESTSLTQPGVSGSGVNGSVVSISGKKPTHRSRGNRHGKSNKNHDYPLLCEFMEMAWKMESLLHGVKKQGKSLFGDNAGSPPKPAVNVPGKSPDGGPSRNAMRRLQYEKKKQHEIFIGSVLESVINNNVVPGELEEIKNKLLVNIAEDKATIEETVKKINEYSEKLKEEHSQHEKRGIAHKEKYNTGQKIIQESVLVIDNELLELLDVGIDPARKTTIINHIQEHQRITEEKNDAREEEFKLRKKTKMDSPIEVLKTPFVGAAYDQSDSESCTSSGSDE
jgi:hypothetical protein